jgi:hypothetical protein
LIGGGEQSSLQTRSDGIIAPYRSMAEGESLRDAGFLIFYGRKAFRSKGGFQ